MPLYDCMLLLKTKVSKDAVMDLVHRIGKHVYNKNGVVTNMKSYGEVNLGYGIRKLDGRHYQGQMFQITMMSPPSINKELHYLNKEDRLLRWLVVKHRDFKFGTDSAAGEDFSLFNEPGAQGPLHSNLISDDDNLSSDSDDIGGDEFFDVSNPDGIQKKDLI